MKSNVKILYEDRYIIVCDKPAGIPCQSRDVQTKDVVSILKNHMRQAQADAGAKGQTDDRRQADRARRRTGSSEAPYLATIHRLDEPVRGILVYAKTPYAARELNEQLKAQRFKKYYLALVDGEPPEERGILEDYLVKDYLTNTSRVCDPDTSGAKLARLSYQVLKEGQEDYLLGQEYFHLDPEGQNPVMLHIRLETGRHHQIRVQLANIGCPIIGDVKYNHRAEAGEQICLCAYRLSFYHPSSHKYMCFQLDEPPMAKGDTPN